MNPSCVPPCLLLVVWLGLSVAAPAADKKKPPVPSALDRYIVEASTRPTPGGASGGGIWEPGAIFGNLGADLRAARVDELVTILVAENASATSRGTVTSKRSSSARSAVDALGGTRVGALPKLLDLSTDRTLEGEGGTSRQAVLTATLTARITHVLPNGYLVIDGSKIVTVNTDQHVVAVRGVVRPADIDPGNVVDSNRIAQMELTVNGKGVIADAVRRPNILYRLLLGILPF